MWRKGFAHLEPNGNRSGRLAVNGDLGRIAAEARDVLLDPFKPKPLIIKTFRYRSKFVSFAPLILQSKNAPAFTDAVESAATSAPGKKPND